MKKRILIIYATYGSGHLAVAKYIEDYFKKENSDYEILSIDLLKYSIPVLGEISRVVNNTVVLKFPIICNAALGISNNKIISYGTIETNIKKFENKKLFKLIKDFDPDIVLSTHFYGSAIITKLNRQNKLKSLLITIVTDYKAHELWLQNYKSEDAIIVSNNETKKDLIRKCPEIDKNKIKNFGIPIFNRMDNALDYNKLLQKHHIKNDKPIITFFGGSSYAVSNSYQYFHKLIKSNINAYVFYVTGNAKGLREKAEKLVKKYNASNVKVLGYINNVPEYMTMSDLIITKPGGVLVNECVFFGKPMLLISGAGPEKENYRYLVRKGFAVRASNTFAFIKHLEHLINNKEILNMMKENVKNYDNKEALPKLYKLVQEILKDKCK